MARPKPQYTKKMIAACKRRIKQYEEMIKKGIVTEWFKGGYNTYTIICSEKSPKAECAFGPCSPSHCSCADHITAPNSEESLEDLSVGDKLTSDALKAAKARLAYLKKMFKRKGIIR